MDTQKIINLVEEYKGFTNLNTFQKKAELYDKLNEIHKDDLIDFIIYITERGLSLK